jgi:ankyrin repeat protein
VKLGKALGWLLAFIPVAVLCGFDVKSNGFLLWSIHHRFRSLARVSLSLGADPNAKDNSHTVLMETAFRGQPDIVEALLARGAAIDAMDDAHRQALYYAARNGRVDGSVVRVLLEHGANPVAPGDGGVTPLMRAANEESGGMAMSTLAGTRGCWGLRCWVLEARLERW